MKRLIGATLVAFAFAAPAVITQASAETPQTRMQGSASKAATDFSARRYTRPHYRHYGYRPYDQPYYQPHYYARPYYYRPYPYYAPAPFPFGLGFGPFW